MDATSASYDASDAAAVYDHVPAYEARTDVGFYVDEARAADGAVLELGCGSGRVLLPTARAGRRIVGLDLSPGMLAACRARLAAEPAEVQARVRLVEGDLRAFDLGERFGLVTIPFRPLQHLVAIEDQLRCLRAAHAHLAPGGRLVFDVFQPNLARLAAGPTDGEVEDTPETPLPDGRRFRRAFRLAAVHPAAQWNAVELVYYVTGPDGATRRTVQAFPMRWFYRFEVEHLLARCGFAVRAVYGDFDRSPLTDASPEMVFVAERA